MEKNSDFEPVAVRPEEAAQMLGIGKTKMYQLLHSEDFPAFKVGSRTLIPVQELREWTSKMVREEKWTDTYLYV